MELDFDRLFQDEALSIRVRGKSYTCRPLVLADVAQMQKAILVADKDVTAARVMVEGFFVAPSPDCSTWTMRQLLGAVKAILLHWQGAAEKNCQSVSTIIETEMKRLTSGDSTPPS